MMNPFIASLMRQTEEASKRASQQAALASATSGGGMGGGMFGGGKSGGLFGGLFGGGDKGGLFGGLEPMLASLNPTAATEPTYTPSPSSPPAASAPAGPTSSPVPPPIVPSVMATPEEVFPDDPVKQKWTRNDPGATPGPSAQELARVALLNDNMAQQPVDPQPERDIIAEDTPWNQSLLLPGYMQDESPAMLNAMGVPVGPQGYIVPGPQDFGINISPTGWNGTQAAIDASVPLSGMVRDGAVDTMSELLAGPYAEAQVRFGGEIPILDALAKHGTSRERETPGSAHFQGNALDIDISGFSNDERLELLDALTAAGFTDFGLGANSLHADARGRGGNWSYGGGYGGLSYGDAVARINQGRQAYASGNVPPAPEVGGWAMSGERSPSETMMTKGNPVAGMYSPRNDVESTVYNAFEQAGYDPVMGLAFASIESGLNPGTKGGNSYWGLFQNDRNAMEAAGLDWSSAADSTQYALDNMGKTVPYFERQVGRSPEPFEVYMLHQQGIAGATGLAKYPDLPAWQAIQKQVEAEGGSISEAKAKSHIRGNIPSDVSGVSVDSPASAFTNMWRQKFASHYNRFTGGQQYAAPSASPRPSAAPTGVFSTKAPGGLSGAMTWAGGDDWKSPYDHTNLAIFGGVGSPTDPDGLWHGWNSSDRWAHDNDHEDYSQFYREFTYEPKEGYVPVGQREGRTVYAAPAPEYVDGKSVDRDLYVDEAKRRGALIPTEDEMRAFYEQAQAVKMPTIPRGGGPNDRISFDDVPDGPWYGPKEFYRKNNAPAMPWSLAEIMQSPEILAQILYGGK